MPGRWSPILACTLAAFLTACDKPGPPPAAPPPVGLTLTGKSVEIGHWAKACQFSLDASGCSSITLKLHHISGKGLETKTEYVYKKLSARVQGTFALIEQHGEAFDKAGQIFFELQQEIPAGSQSATSTSFPILQGPFPQVSEQFHKDGPLSSGTESVVFARCMSDSTNHSFGAGSLESLTKHAAETKDVIVAITLLWER